MTPFLLVSILLHISLATSDAIFSKNRIAEAQEIVPPTYISMKDIYGNDVSEISLFKYQMLTEIHFKTNGTDVTWTLSPNLPEGLVFDSTWLVLNGTPRQEQSLGEYTITASNAAGSVSKTFTLEVKGCPYGEFYFPRIYGYNNMYLEISQNDNILFADDVDSSTMYVKPLCLPRGELSYYLNCTASQSLCIFQLQDESHNLYFMEKLKLHEASKGTFVSTPNAAPVIRYRSVVSTYNSEISTSVVMVDGIHTGLSIKPEIPEVQLDPVFGVLTVNATLDSLTSFTISARNEKGEVEWPFVIAVDTCPEDSLLFKMIRSEKPSYDTIELYNSAGVQEYDMKIAQDVMFSNLCLQKDEEYTWRFKLAEHTINSWRESNGLYLNYGDTLFAQFNRPKYVESEERHFRITEPIAFNSTYRYSFDFAYKWKALDYHDDAWKSGFYENWGTFTNTTKAIYYRNIFSIDDVSKYSLIHLSLLSGDSANVYLNEKLVLSVNGSLHAIQYTLPISYLNNDKNILAIELNNDIPSIQHDIVFDASIMLVTSGCLLLSENGIASSEEPGVENAFDLNPETSWSFTHYPTTAQYTFGDNAKHVVNQVMVKFGKKNWPVSLRIEAIDKNGTVPLFQLSPDSMYPMTNYHYFSFDNTIAYSSYQVVFEKSFYEDSLEVEVLRFFACSPLMCKRAGNVEDSPLDTTAYLKCPIGKVGTRHMICKNHDNHAEWDDIMTTCLAKYPPKQWRFIDWSIVFQNITSYYDVYLLPNINRMLVELLHIEEESIQTVFVRDLSTPMMNSLRVDLRLTIQDHMIAGVSDSLNRMIEHLDEHLRTYFTHFPNIHGEIAVSPVMYKPLNLALIISLSTLIILLPCVYYLLKRYRNKEQPIENVSLLSV